MLRSTFGALLLGVSLLGVSEWEKLGTGSRLSPSRISSRPSINNNLPRSLSKTQLSSVDDWGGMQEKWAVVQIYDYRSDSVNAAAALLSTHEALRELNMSQRVDHVAYVTMDPVGVEGDDLQMKRTHRTALALFQEVGIKLVYSAEVAPPSIDKEAMATHFDEPQRFYEFFYKLTLFGLVQYDRVLFIDNDVILLKDMTELFKRSQAVDAIRTTSASGGGANNTALYAVADVVSGMCYNTGVMAFTPRLADMNGIFQLLLNAPKEAWLSRCTPQPHTDQEIITFYFQSLNRLEALPPDYNTFIGHHGHDDFQSRDGWVVNMPVASTYMKWAMHSPQSRASIHAMHLQWPKPTWPVWVPESMRDQEDLDFQNTNFFPKTGVWSEYPGWFAEYSRYGEVGLSFLGLYKTFWSREVALLTRLCDSESTKHVTNVSVVNVDTNGQKKAHVSTFNLAEWCEIARVGRNGQGAVIYPDDEFSVLLEKKIGLLQNSGIPTWEETLEANFPKHASAQGESARLAFAAELESRSEQNPKEAIDEAETQNETEEVETEVETDEVEPEEVEPDR